ncbi:MAG TPA: hypothetical protein ENK19_09400 [Acidobacteria bacterium]|nr:hypothetical protein [Acidobacteriota bacterium]
MNRNRIPLQLASLLSVILLATSGCGHKKSASAPAAPSAAIPGLGITLEHVPAAFRISSQAKDRLVLVPADPKLGGTLTIAAEPASSGLNLQEAVKRHRKEIEGRPQGKYLGAQELSGPTGTAYWSRGRFQSSDREVEETQIVTLDPTQHRIIDLTYDYPAGNDSRQRVRALLDVVGEINAYVPPAAGTKKSD